MIRVRCIKCAVFKFGTSNGTLFNRTRYLLQHRKDHLLFARLNALTAYATVDKNAKFGFHFTGVGPCTIKLGSADGHVIIFTGKLPHDRDHTYLSTANEVLTVQ